MACDVKATTIELAYINYSKPWIRIAVSTAERESADIGYPTCSLRHTYKFDSQVV